MIPIVLDPRHGDFALAGNGTQALRRLALLRQAGAEHLRVFADAPSAALLQAAPFLQRRLPEPADLAGIRALWIAGLGAEQAARLAAAARAAGVLVNTEDRTELCDFHSPAEIRRGDLLLTVSTHGRAPGLARAIREKLENCFGPEWAERVEEVAGLRAAWRQEGISMAEASRRIAALLAERCWLSCPAN